MLLFITGDVHGNFQHANKMVDRAVELKADAIVQLGDFGIWPGPNGDKFLRKLDLKLGMAGLNWYFVDGNHEDFPKLAKLSVPRQDGFRTIRIPGVTKYNGHILHIPRGHVWEWDSVRFAGMGGAVSVDREWREPGKSWWPEEQITLLDEETFERNLSGEEVDVLFTHDSTTSYPPKHRIKNDPASHAHRQVMDRMVQLAKPMFHFHGHWHEFNRYVYTHPPDGELITDCIALECDDMTHTYCLFNTADVSVEFPTVDAASNYEDNIYRDTKGPGLMI